MTVDMFFQMFFNGLQLSSVYILAALGFTLIFGILHIVNMAHGSIYMLGAYTLWILLKVMHIHYILAIVISMIFMGLLGLALERAIFRRLEGAVMPTIIVSLGLSQVINQSALLIFGTTEKVVSNPFPGVVHILGTVFPTQRMVILMIGMVLTILLVWWVQKSKAGLALRAVALDRETASLYGIGFNRYGATAFGVGCALAGAAGALVAPLFYIDPFIGDGPLMKVFVIIVLGGLGSVPGAILAGLLLGLVDSFVTTMYDSNIAAIVGFIMIVVTLILRPRGFFGHE